MEKDKDTENSSAGNEDEGDELDPGCIINFTKKLIRIEYPGHVVNVDKALETLGGIDNIQNVVSNPRNPLELKFHPENKFNKPCTGVKDYNPGILLKITKKVPKATEDNPNPKPIFEQTVVGVTAQNIVFDRLCDFQWLPVKAEEPENKNSEAKCIYNDIIPDKLPDPSFLINNEAQEVPLYLPPDAFAKFDTPKNKLYLDVSEKFETNERPEVIQALVSNKSNRLNDKILSKHFKRGYLIDLLTCAEVPQKPPDSIVKFIESRNLHEDFEKINSLFEERPICSRQSIINKTKVSTEHLKFVLPAVAYYSYKGPWRCLWIKYGYDPRKHPTSRKYQSLDYRNKITGPQQNIGEKRVASGSTDWFPEKVWVKQEAPAPETDKSDLEEKCFILKPSTVLPIARQRFYQLCDIQLPEIQEMFMKLPEPSKDAKFDKKYGWLPAKFIDQCRESINKYVIQACIDREKSKKRDPAPSTSEPGLSSPDFDYNQMMNKMKLTALGSRAGAGTSKNIGREYESDEDDQMEGVIQEEIEISDSDVELSDQSGEEIFSKIGESDGEDLE